jgi:hypothetical protein
MSDRSLSFPRNAGYRKRMGALFIGLVDTLRPAFLTLSFA